MTNKPAKGLEGARGANEDDAWEINVMERRGEPGEWIVERIDISNKGDGDIEFTLFSGPRAEERANVYASALSPPPPARLAREAVAKIIRQHQFPLDAADAILALTAGQADTQPPPASAVEGGG